MNNNQIDELRKELEEMHLKFIERLNKEHIPGHEFFYGMEAGKVGLIEHLLEKYFGVTHRRKDPEGEESR